MPRNLREMRSLQRQPALILIGFRLEELEDLRRYVVVLRKQIKIRAGWRWRLRISRRFRGIFDRWSVVERRRVGESETIALLKCSNVFDNFVAGVADFEEVGFEQG